MKSLIVPFQLPPAGRPLFVSMVRLFFYHLGGLIVIGIFLFIGSFVYAHIANKIMHGGQFNDMLGFGEAVIAIGIFLYIVCPIVFVVFVVQVVRLFRRDLATRV